MKRIFYLFALFWSFSAFAAPLYSNYSNCPQGLPDDNPEFCSSFKSVASCHCVESGLPKGMCQDVNLIYNRMISMFGSVQKACEWQHDTDTQTCVDYWSC